MFLLAINRPIPVNIEGGYIKYPDVKRWDGMSVICEYHRIELILSGDYVRRGIKSVRIVTRHVSLGNVQYLVYLKCPIPTAYGNCCGMKVIRGN